jgi:hypothetical protein
VNKIQQNRSFPQRLPTIAVGRPVDKVFAKGVLPNEYGRFSWVFKKQPANAGLLPDKSVSSGVIVDGVSVAP